MIDIVEALGDEQFVRPLVRRPFVVDVEERS